MIGTNLVKILSLFKCILLKIIVQVPDFKLYFQIRNEVSILSETELSLSLELPEILKCRWPDVDAIRGRYG